MQRLSNGLLVVQIVQDGTMSFCQLPTGEWQVGTERNTAPIRSIDDIKDFASERTMAIIEASLEELAERGEIEQGRQSDAAQALLDQRLSGMTLEMRQEVEELVEDYLAIAPALRLQVKAMLRAFVQSQGVPETAVVLPRPAFAHVSPQPMTPFKSASQELYPGDRVVGEESASGGVIRNYESGRREFVPSQAALDSQIKTEEKAHEPDAVPAYPCAYCSKSYPGEKSRDLHQERCKEKPAAVVAAPAT
jgi:hypothetical protein